MKPEEVTRKEPKTLSRSAKDRQSEVISSHNLISKFNFDDDNGEWCEFKLDLSGDSQKLLMVNIVEEICRKVVVREIYKNKSCLHPQPEVGGKLTIDH